MKPIPKLIVSRINTDGPLALVKWIIYIMSSLLILTGLLLLEYVVVIVGASFIALGYLFMKLIAADKVCFYENHIELSFFNIKKRNFSKEQIIAIGAFKSVVVAPRVIKVHRINWSDVNKKEETLAFDLILISTIELPQTFNPSFIAYNRKTILMNFNEQALLYLKQHYADKMLNAI